MPGPGSHWARERDPAGGAEQADSALGPPLCTVENSPGSWFPDPVGKVPTGAFREAAATSPHTAWPRRQRVSEPDGRPVSLRQVPSLFIQLKRRSLQAAITIKWGTSGG